MHILPATLSRFLWFFCKKHLRYFLGFFVLLLYRAAQVALTPYMMKLLIDRLSSSDLSIHQVYSLSFMPAMGYICFNILYSIAHRIDDWIGLTIYPVMKNEIIVEMFKYVEGHSYSYFQQSFSGSLANKINDLAKGSIRITSEIFNTFISSALSFAVGIASLYFVHPVFSLVLFIWAVLFLLVSLYISQRANLYYKKYFEYRSAIVGRVVDSLTNILNVKLFAREKHEKEYLQDIGNETAKEDKALQWYLLKVKSCYAVFITALISMMIFLLVQQRAYGYVSGGDFAFVLGMILTLIDQVYGLAFSLMSFTEDVGMSQQALQILSSEYEIVDKPNAPKLAIHKGAIEFHNVTFKYKKRPNPIFSNLFVSIKPGQKIGVVGFSGSGKSTFVSLLLRFYDLELGSIAIDGQDIASVTQKSLRKKIAFIPQDPLLFHRSLKENIRYGQLDATDEEVLEASKKAYCHEFIEKLPEKYDTLVGERGIKLSGGQRQRIAIARAILKNAPILIMDEATSALDSVTEKYIQKSLSEFMQQRTSIIVAHRLSTLFSMDRILVFKDGKIVEDGKHQELINRENGHYATLWKMQAGGLISTIS